MAVPLLTFILPAYNEAPRLAGSLGQVLACLAEQPYTCELLLVDDGSTDDTTAVARQFCATYAGPVAIWLFTCPTNRGKGHAVRQGLWMARSELAVFSDVDLSTPLTELPRLLAPLLTGRQDVVLGSRALDRRRVGRHQNWLRESSGRFFNWVMRLATGLPYADTQCGFKAFRVAAVRPLLAAAVVDGFAFDVEMLYLAHHAGLRILELPVAWNNMPGSKVTLRGGLAAFWELGRLRARARRGQYAGAGRAARPASAE